MREEAWDDVMMDGVAVAGGGFGEERGHVQDVSDEKARFRATDALFRHYFPNAARDHAVAYNARLHNFHYAHN